MMNDELFPASEVRFRRVIEANADGIIIVNKDGLIRYANPAAEKLFARSREELVGRMFGFPIVVSQTTEINILNEGGTTAEMRVVDIDWQQETAYLASLRDITERKQAEKALQARERFLTWLNNITRAALETPDFQAMLQIFADRLGDLFDADGCYITVWDEARETAVPGAVSHHIQPHSQLIEPDETQTSMTAAVLQAKEAVIVDRMWNSPYTKTHTASLFSIQSTLGLPLIAGEHKLGAAFIIFQEPHKFTATEITQGEQVVGHIALALAKAKSLMAERQQRMLAETLSNVISALNNSLSPE
ncbi:MAG: PAS domain S-box protein, partial [Chloroflexota bacterium]